MKRLFDKKTGLTLKDSGTRAVFITGANRDMQHGKGRCDLLPMFGLEELSRLMEAGCLKYGDRNWEKGIPLHVYMSSGIRHIIKHIRGDRDEDHLLAGAWNFMCALDTRERIRRGILPKELDDLPEPYEQTRNRKSPRKSRRVSKTNRSR